MEKIYRVQLLTSNPDDGTPLREVFDCIRQQRKERERAEERRQRQLSEGNTVSVYHPGWENQVPN